MLNENEEKFNFSAHKRSHLWFWKLFCFYLENHYRLQDCLEITFWKKVHKWFRLFEYFENNKRSFNWLFMNQSANEVNTEKKYLWNISNWMDFNYWISSRNTQKCSKTQMVWCYQYFLLYLHLIVLLFIIVRQIEVKILVALKKKNAGFLKY